MKLKFFGAAGGVTGSKTVLSINGENYLIDYGLFQGGSKVREKNWKDFQHLSQVNGIFLTHAHIDHSGLLPRLAKQNYQGKIYCTPQTLKLCQILLKDAAHIQEEDAKYANKTEYSRHKPALPLYTVEDAEKILSQFEAIDFNLVKEISPRVSIKFHYVAHILGAAGVEITVKAKEEGESDQTMFFSGDLGHERQMLLAPPAPPPICDVMILESTYGKRLHPRTPAKEILASYLNVILKKGGVAIIPSFSVGRTQEILFLIKQLFEEKIVNEVPVILDSPLSKKANRIFLEEKDSFFIRANVLEDGHPFPDRLEEIETALESKEVAKRDGPMIIVSASGMLDGGRVLHHLKDRISESKNGVILVGYQPEGTKGRLLLDGIKTLRIHKKEYPVRANTFFINSLSAHADYLDTLDWLKKGPIPKLIILNHGEKSSARNMKLLLETTLETKVTVASLHEEYFI